MNLIDNILSILSIKTNPKLNQIQSDKNNENISNIYENLEFFSSLVEKEYINNLSQDYFKMNLKESSIFHPYLYLKIRNQTHLFIKDVYLIKNLKTITTIFALSSNMSDLDFHIYIYNLYDELPSILVGKYFLPENEHFTTTVESVFLRKIDWKKQKSEIYFLFFGVVEKIEYERKVIIRCKVYQINLSNSDKSSFISENIKQNNDNDGLINNLGYILFSEYLIIFKSNKKNIKF